MNNKIITIDGPSASGKGTIAKKIADILGFNYLDSGVLYRILAYIYSSQPDFSHDINTENIQQCQQILIDKFNHSKILFENNNIFLENINITSFIRSETIGTLASILAANQNIRIQLLDWQRKYALAQGLEGLVTDGRDMGTVVFPNAKCKIFLIADVNKRAQRRYEQIISQTKNQDVKLNDILLNLKQRDERDINRSSSPLKPSNDAFILDNSNLTIEETVNIVLTYYKTV